MSEKPHEFLHSSLVCIYAQLLPRIRERAKKMGYAVAIHGSMSRDLDLLAVPWVEDAVAPEELVEAIAQEVGGYVMPDRANREGTVQRCPTVQPHGRLSWNVCWGGRPFIDLSVMPRQLREGDDDRTAG